MSALSSTPAPTGAAPAAAPDARKSAEPAIHIHTAFITYLKTRNDIAAKKYQIQEVDGLEYEIGAAESSVTPVQVISLEPAPFER